MTGLWTNDRDTLVTWLADSYAGPEPYEGYNAARVDDLLARGDVRVLDPGDTELVERGAEALWNEAQYLPRATPWCDLAGDTQDEWRSRIRSVIEAL
jgi:hypothetical protein